MSVQGIFKILIGTICIMIISFFIIEIYNASVASPQLKALTQVALRQSCQYFAQETYKDGKGNAYQIIGRYPDSESISAIDPALNGRFYAATGSENIYRSLYGNGNAGFVAFLNDSQNSHWRRLNILKYALGYGGSIGTGEDILGKYYVQDMLTPLNIGIAYLDKPTVERIFKWELVNILMHTTDSGDASSGSNKSDMVIINPSGENYVKYKGFRVYYNTLKVTDIKYKTYDLMNSADKVTFQELTNIDVDKYLARNSSSNSLNSDERRYVAVAELSYSMHVGFEGITPMSRIMTWVFDYETQAVDKSDWTSQTTVGDSNRWNPSGLVQSRGDKGAGTGQTYYASEQTNLSNWAASNRDAVTGMTNNFSNTGSSYTLDNKIIYYIIR